MIFIISVETDDIMEESVQPAHTGSTPDHAEEEVPDEENLNQEQGLEQSRTEDPTPEQREGNLHEIQGKMWPSVQLP